MARPLYDGDGSLLSLDSTCLFLCPLLSISADMGMLRILGEDQVLSDLFDSRIPKGARVIDIATRYDVFRSMPLSRLACFFYSLTSSP